MLQIQYFVNGRRAILLRHSWCFSGSHFAANSIITGRLSWFGGEKLCRKSTKFVSNKK